MMARRVPLGQTSWLSESYAESYAAKKACIVLQFVAVTRITAPSRYSQHHCRMHPQAWLGLRCCRMKMRERILRWRRRQAQMRQ